MIAKPHFEKTNKCKNAMLFEKKISKISRNSQKMMKVVTGRN
jgi:hypothetical protein